MEYPNIEKEEFDCPCCGKNNMDEDFLFKIIAARIIAEIPFVITSGCRCVLHNSDPKVGGSPTSSHLKGIATDIYCDGSRSRYIILKVLLAVGFHRIKIGKNFIHVDDDKTKSKKVIWLK